MSGCILVAGGTSDIGAAVVAAALRSGRDVVFTWKDDLSRARALAENCGPLRCRPLRYDGAVAPDAATIEAAFQGSDALDALVNCIGASHSALVADTDASSRRVVLDVNIEAPLRLIERFWPMLRRAKRADIINVSSAAVANRRPGNALYGASKSFMDRYLEGCALEGARFGVRCNTVTAGFVEGRMLDAAFPDEATRRVLRRDIPSKRFQTPDEVARVVLWLLDCPSFVTGASIPVTGGGHL